jgi:hypothetical protein
MNTDNVGLVIVLVLGIVILSNLVMFVMVRGSRIVKFDWLKHIREDLNKPLKSTDRSLEELRQRVQQIKEDEDDAPD